MRRRSPLTGTPRTSLLQTWTQGASPVYRVQRGTVTITVGNTTGTGTIANAVVVANTRLKNLGSNDAGADAITSQTCYVQLTNTTTVTATVLVAPSASITLKFEVVEYFTGVLRSVQRAAIAIGAGSGSNTATITAVDTTKSELTSLGQTTGAADARNGIYLELTNATTVTATNNAAAAAETIGFEVAEYF